MAIAPTLVLAWLGLALGPAAEGEPHASGDGDVAGATGGEVEEGGAEATEAEALPEPEPEAEAEPDSGTEAEAEELPEADAEPASADGGSPGGASGGGASGGGSVGAPTGGAATPGATGSLGRRVDSDDDDLETDDDGDRRGRRRRNRDRPDEGEWRVFAPYPELGPIRYRDPELRRTLWLGLDATGTYLPSSLGLSEHSVSTIRPAGAWALSLTPWLAVGGRHSVAWYDADTLRLRVHAHQAELSGRPLAASRPGVRLDDRLAFGISAHAIRSVEVDGETSAPGGLLDTIIHLDYGLDHLLGTRWRLGWKVQGRYAWVNQDTQRQARASMRLAFHPRPPHRLSLDAVGYYVNRDSEQGGLSLPRNSIYGQLGLGYSWISRAGVGPWTQVRATSGFMSGEAPVYELREDVLDAGYGEVLVGMLARWP